MPVAYTWGDPKVTRIFLKKIIYFSEHFHNLITFNTLLEKQYTYPTAFSIVQNSSGTLAK